MGKNHLIRTFVQSAYRSVVIIDFLDIQPVVREIFENYSHDQSEFFSRLSIATGIALYPRESCIVLDEVQLSPKARQLVKRLVADGRFDILETGSFISLRANVKDIVIPSEEERIELLPLDLEEFAEAVGKKMLFDAARTAFQSDKGLGDALHREMMKLVRLYMVVGGHAAGGERIRRHEEFVDCAADSENYFGTLFAAIPLATKVASFLAAFL